MPLIRMQLSPDDPIWSEGSRILNGQFSKSMRKPTGSTPQSNSPSTEPAAETRDQPVVENPAQAQDE